MSGKKTVSDAIAVTSHPVPNFRQRFTSLWFTQSGLPVEAAKLTSGKHFAAVLAFILRVVDSNPGAVRPISPKRLRHTFSLCIMSTILLIILILLLIGALPAWPYSHGWGYYPSGGLGLLLLILIILALVGAI
jgi:hypothetical protein